MKKWILAALLLTFAVGAQAQSHCLIKVAPTAERHNLDVTADCGSDPDEQLFAEALQNTLRQKATIVGVLNYMVDRNWELLEMEKTIRTNGDADTPPTYYTEFLFKKR